MSDPNFTPRTDFLCEYHFDQYAAIDRYLITITNLTGRELNQYGIPPGTGWIVRKLSYQVLKSPLYERVRKIAKRKVPIVGVSEAGEIGHLVRQQLALSVCCTAHEHWRRWWFEYALLLRDIPCDRRLLRVRTSVYTWMRANAPGE